MSYGTTCLDFMTDDVVVPIDTWREEAFEALLSQGRSSGLASSIVSSGIPVTRGLSSILGSGGAVAGGALAAAGLIMGVVPALFSPASNQKRDKEIVLPDKTGRTLVQKCGFPRALYEEFETIAVLEKKLGPRQSYVPILRNIATYTESISRFFLLHHVPDEIVGSVCAYAKETEKEQVYQIGLRKKRTSLGHLTHFCRIIEKAIQASDAKVTQFYCEKMGTVECFEDGSYSKSLEKIVPIRNDLIHGRISDRNQRDLITLCFGTTSFHSWWNSAKNAHTPMTKSLEGRAILLSCRKR